MLIFGIIPFFNPAFAFPFPAEAASAGAPPDHSKTVNSLNHSSSFAKYHDTNAKTAIPAWVTMPTRGIFLFQAFSSVSTLRNRFKKYDNYQRENRLDFRFRDLQNLRSFSDRELLDFNYGK